MHTHISADPTAIPHLITACARMKTIWTSKRVRARIAHSSNNLCILNLINSLARSIYVCVCVCNKRPRERRQKTLYYIWKISWIYCRYWCALQDILEKLSTCDAVRYIVRAFPSVCVGGWGWGLVWFLSMYAVLMCRRRTRAASNIYTRIELRLSHALGMNYLSTYE